MKSTGEAPSRKNVLVTFDGKAFNFVCTVTEDKSYKEMSNSCRIMLPPWHYVHKITQRPSVASYIAAKSLLERCIRWGFSSIFPTEQNILRRYNDVQPVKQMYKTEWCFLGGWGELSFDWLLIIQQQIGVRHPLKMSSSQLIWWSCWSLVTLEFTLYYKK